MLWIRSGAVRYSHAVRKLMWTLSWSPAYPSARPISLYLVVTKSNSDESVASPDSDFRKTGSAPLHHRQGWDGQNDSRGRPGTGSGTGGQAGPPRRMLPGCKLWIRTWRSDRLKLPAGHERSRKSRDVSMHHQRALWRRPRDASDAGNDIGNGRLAAPPHTRARTSGLPFE